MEFHPGTSTARLSTAKRLRPPAQGCRFGYPGKPNSIRHNPDGVATNFPVFPNVAAKRDNVGLEAVTASRYEHSLTLRFQNDLTSQPVSQDFSNFKSLAVAFPLFIVVADDRLQ